MIRVSIGYYRTREEALSEIMWVDDLKQFSDTICEPSPSLHHNLAEEFDINGKHYRATMFRTAKGNVKEVKDLGWKDILLVGDLLGRIHKESRDAAAQGILYKRPKWYEKRERGMKTALPKQEEYVRKYVTEVFETIKALGESPDIFGMIHGDFHINNFFIDGNNIWVFDFDECSYGYFMYDIASVISTWLMYLYKPEKTRRAALYEDILPYFRQGYDEHVKLPEEHWALLELFLKDRQCVIANALYVIEESGVLSDMEQMRRYAVRPFQFDDFMEGMEVAVKEMGEVQLKSADAKQTVHKKSDDNETSGVIVFEGRIMTDNVKEYQERLDHALSQGAKELTIDCEKLAFISSVGIRILLIAYQQLEGRLRLVHVNETVEEILYVTGLSETLIDKSAD